MASAPATLRYIYQAPVYQYYVGKIFVIKVPLCETVVAMTTTTMLVEVCTRLFAATPRAMLRSHRRLFSERLRWRRFPLIMWSCISFNSRSACVQTVLNSAHTHTHLAESSERSNRKENCNFPKIKSPNAICEIFSSAARSCHIRTVTSASNRCTVQSHITYALQLYSFENVIRANFFFFPIKFDKLTFYGQNTWFSLLESVEIQNEKEKEMECSNRRRNRSNIRVKWLAKKHKWHPKSCYDSCIWFPFFFFEHFSVKFGVGPTLNGPKCWLFFSPLYSTLLLLLLPSVRWSTVCVFQPENMHVHPATKWSND